jgi:hypothetical protein
MPIGKKKTALTDANQKKENSFNRCQSEKRKQLSLMPIGKNQL